MITARGNLLRAVRFERPDYVPMSFHISAACWHHYPQEALLELMAAHPLLFPEFEMPPGPVSPEYAPWRRAGKPYTDSWGCVWETMEDGLKEVEQLACKEGGLLMTFGLYPGAPLENVAALMDAMTRYATYCS